jgi:polysaccharide deacetylase family protein (PEP-CTERM system associated)
VSPPLKGSGLAAFSVDVEDYFQAEALRPFCPRPRWADFEDRTETNTCRLLEMLDRRGIKGTFFVLGWTARRHPGLVKRIAGAGHEVASHGENHELIYQQTPDDFRRDVKDSRALLQDLAGQDILGYRAPSYSIVERTRWALTVLAEEGYRYDSSIFPIKRKKYGIPSAPRRPHVIETPNGGSLVEFPMPTVRLWAFNLPATGGAYLRLLPWTFQEWAFKSLLATGLPVVVNVHPWETDPLQPRFPLRWPWSWTHYHNLECTESRLDRLFGLASFQSQVEVLKSLGFL